MITWTLTYFIYFLCPPPKKKGGGEQQLKVKTVYLKTYLFIFNQNYVSKLELNEHEHFGHQAIYC